MTIKELIEKLKEYPEDMCVNIYATYDGGYLAGGTVQYLEKDSDNTVALYNEEG